MSYSVIPYVYNGATWNITDEALIKIFRFMQAENKIRDLFYRGDVLNEWDFILYAKNPRNHFLFVADAGRVVHLCWLNDIGPHFGWLHHASVGPWRRGAWKALIEYFRIEVSGLRLLFGLTPASNAKALKAAKLCKWTILQPAIPGVCSVGGEFIDGFMSFYEVHHGNPNI